MYRLITYVWISGLTGALVGLSCAGVSAGTVELINGDVIHGQVMSLDEHRLTLRSESFGEINIERAKLATIHLVNKSRKGSRPATVASVSQPGTLLKNAPSGQDVLQQLRTAGALDASDLKAVQQKFPLLGNPEVKQYFNERLSGLLTGRLDLQDIRKDAVKAADQIRDLQKDLGPQSAALNGYLSILQNFIDETAPSDAEPEAKPKSNEAARPQ